MHKLLLVFFFSVYCITGSGHTRQVNPGLLKAALVKKNITPSVAKNLLGYAARQSTGILDSIFHRILLLDDGASKFLLVVSDLCLVSPSEYDRVAHALHKKTGIDPLHFWWSCTHTHSAPEVGVPGLPEVFMEERYTHTVDTAYTGFVEQALLSGVTEALQKMEPVNLAVGWGYSDANINRRTWGTDKKAAFGMNPDGAVDRRIGIIRLLRPDGTLLGMLANYAIHATVLGPQNLKISGDVAGVVAGYVEEKTGVPLLFINGAAGNLAPLYSVYPTPGAGHLSQFKVLLGDRIIDAASQADDVLAPPTLTAGQLIVQTPVKTDLKKWPADLKQYLQSGTGLIQLPVRFLKLHPSCVIWSAPLELFCEISNNVRDQSPFDYTLYFGYTNGWLGYLPTAKAWENGGYEVHKVSPFSISAEKDLTLSVLDFLKTDAFDNLKESNIKKQRRSKKEQQKN